MAENINRPVITRELLKELADWRTEKEGRALAAAGNVLQWDYQPPFLSGTVRTGGGTTITAKIKLGARAFEVENLCVCRQARDKGRICPHVMALVYATILPAKPAGPQVPAVSARPKVREPGLKHVPLEEAGDENQSLELMVLLPLDLPRAWKTGELRIIIEGRVAGGAFTPFDVIPKQTAAPYAVSEADEVLLTEVERIHAGHMPGVWMLSRDDADAFFDALTDHPRVWLGKKTRIEVRGAEVRPSLKLTLEKTGELRLLLSAGGTPDFGNWRFDGKTLTRTCRLPAMYTAGERRLSRVEFAKFYQQELPAWEKMAEVEFSPEFDLLEFEAKAAPTRVTIDGGLTGLNLELHVPAETDWTPDPENPFRYWRYYIVANAEILRAGFEQMGKGFRLASENRVGKFIANILPEWEDGWQVEYGPQFTRFLWLCDRIEPEIAVRAAGNDWLAVDVSYKSDTAVLTNADVQRMLQKGAAHHRQANGRIALVPSEAVAGFQDVIFDCQAEQSKTGLRVERKFAPYLAEALRESSLQTKWQVPAEVRTVQPLELPGLLRPYQKDGVNWLHHLSQNNLAGILADEMGLGKTVQALFWLASLKAKPMLVVCPTSLLTNWQTEVARFTPELKTLVLHGADREFEGLKEYDLVITSYALLRRDIVEHQKISWQAVVLDEAQHIKNRFSQIAQAVKELRAKHRLVLTGTPVENSLGDLWSIFDFLMPGYLGPATEFRDRYEKQSDEATMKRLRQRLRPFVLRRLKSEVAKELPAKIEQITWCELTDEQKSVYQSILTQGRREVFEKTKESQRRMAVLTTLLRLRQASCHLGLLPGEHVWKEPSAKLATFLELIEEAVDGNHRVLVFSQFVKLLKLVQEALPVEYCYLDGSTVDRAGEIRRFQESKIPVFLISLKAGGTGLNLTGADTVIHLDPWWNPAVEEQATARAHRIGQAKIVTSYKLIA
ncbi:MAG: DEAD/DEAH box helicase, partial [Verrucomicrobiota bacterium]